MARSMVRAGKDVWPKLGETVLAAVIILATALIALWIVKAVFGPADFPALTVLVATTGAAVAVTQLSAASTERFQERAKSLTFASKIISNVITIANGKGWDDEYSKETMKRKLQTLALALQSIQPKSLPSARSMSLLIDAQADALNIAALFNCEGVHVSTFNKVAASAVFTADQIRDELARLYPVYSFGKVAMYRFGEHLPIEAD